MAEDPVAYPIVEPSRHDPAITAGSVALGGPMGDHAAHGGFWTPLRIIVLVGSVTFWLGFLRTYPCLSNNWLDPDRYEAMCYSDIPILYQLRGLADGYVPYLEWPAGDQPWEYPVLIGGFVWLLSGLTNLLGGPDAVLFYVVNAVAFFACFVGTLVAVALTNRGRPWDAMMLALSPAVLLASFVNWDWPAVLLTALALLGWSRSRPGWAGIALGLAIATKFYPVLLLGPLLLLCWRARRMRAFGVLVAATAGSWAAVNLPVMILGFEGWQYFLTFSADRGGDFGSLWLLLQTAGHPIPPDSVNAVGVALLLVACVGIAALILWAPRRPRVPQVAFLVVAAFLITNKVYSPQFVLWLIPLAILARPRWRDIVWWQAAQAVYFAAIWWYLVGFSEGAKGLPEGWYAAAIAVHLGSTALFAALVVRDILAPEHDPVRNTVPSGLLDDPGGGILDGAPDRHSAPGAGTASTASPTSPTSTAAPARSG